MKTLSSNDRSLNLLKGDLVEVREAAEILATLDDTGSLDGMPFMPEMLEYCGKPFRVGARADKTCDTIDYSGSRRLYNTVHLEGLRCDGRAHGGCQARCLLFWNEAWLRRISSEGAEDGATLTPPDGPPPRCDLERLSRVTRRNDSDDGSVRYRCQITELVRASSPLAWWDPRQYVRDVWSGNIRVMDVMRALLFRGFRLLLKIGAYRALLAGYNRLQEMRNGTPYPFLQGKLDKTPRETLDLKPGELVQVKSYEEVLATLSKRNRNHALWFDAEMVRYCGSVRRVLARVERIIDERNGKMITLTSDCLILEGAVCRAQYSNKRLFCPRAIYPYWREIWLRRAEGPVSAPPSP